MDIVFHVLNIFNINPFVRRGRGQDLHNPNGPGGALFVGIQLRFLVGLGGDHVPSEIILFPILLKEFFVKSKLLSLLRGDGIGNPFRILVVTFEKDVPHGRPFFVLFQKRVQAFEELGIILPDGPGDFALFMDHDILADP